MEIKASAKYLRISPTKLRLVAQTLPGKKVEEALALLQFMPQRGARLVRKVVMSAVANAEQRPQIDVDTLVVKGVRWMAAQSLKRFQARAMGRVNRILKRSSHITVVLKLKDPASGQWSKCHSTAILIRLLRLH
jgi:large subunit ribosomal protein L22